MRAAPEIRNESVAGLFYPGDPRRLRDAVKRMLDGAGVAPADRAVSGVIAPHAGYAFSGVTAGLGYSRVQGRRYDAVVVVSPSHRQFFEGCSVFSGKGYRTPLGTLFVNQEMADELVGAGTCIHRGVRGHGNEHAVEVQIPFLQVALPDVSIVPVVMGNQTEDVSLDLGEALGELAGRHRVLLVASSDLSHFHPRDEALQLDTVMIDHVRMLRYRDLLRDLRNGRVEACGGGPVAAVLAALEQRGVQGFEILRYSTSGEVTGDDTGVVGYMSAVAYA